MSSTRSNLSCFNVKTFNGKGSFTLWQRKVKGILIQQGLIKALKGKDENLKNMVDTKWEEFFLDIVG